MSCRLIDAAFVQNLKKNVDTVIFDCDGVLWNGRGAIPGSADVVHELKKMGKRVFYVTNNSARNRTEYAKKCQDLGFPAVKEDIMCTAHACAQYLKNIRYKGKVYLVGNEAMESELNDVGIPSFGVGPDPVIGKLADWTKLSLDPEVNCVMVGFDLDLGFMKVLKAASYAGRKGCLFVATNLDSILPCPDCEIVIPGTGVMVDAITAAVGRNPIIVGKPQKTMFELLAKSHNLDPSRCLMIGDTLQTDMGFARKCNMTSLFVLSGVNGLEHLPKNGVSPLLGPDPVVSPDYYTSCVGDLLSYLRNNLIIAEIPSQQYEASPSSYSDSEGTKAEQVRQTISMQVTVNIDKKF